MQRLRDVMIRLLKRYLRPCWPLVLALGVIACGPTIVLFATPPAGPVLPGAEVTDFPPTAIPQPTSAFVEPSPTPLPTSPDFVSNAEGLRIFPGPVYYEGDLLSIEVPVLPGLEAIPEDASPTLWIDGAQIDGPAYEVRHPLLNDFFQLPEVWDTSGEVGSHLIEVELPINDTGRVRRFTRTIEVLPASDRPVEEQHAEWETLESDCCILYYISGTAAARDIEHIDALAASTIAEVESQIPGSQVDHFPIVLIDNMWGNGAYATNSEMVISYVDRAYNGLDLRNLIYHEGVHYATSDYGDPPVMMTEGIAVYLTGGHYRQEPIPERAAALVALDKYVPLDQLVSEFRDQQHEVAYIQAAAFISYLVEQKGWDVFLELYAAHYDVSSDYEWLELGLAEYYGLSMSEAETGFHNWLGTKEPGDQIDDFSLTIELFDTMREYQQRYAPYGQLPGIEQAVDQGIVYEFLREPTSAENIAIELALIAAHNDLVAGRYAEVSAMLDVIQQVLDDRDFNRAPMNVYLSLTRLILAAGYEPQTIALNGSQAQAEVIAVWPELQTLNLNFADGEWRLLD